MKKLFIGLMALTSISAFAGEVSCKTLATEYNADRVTQEHINTYCDTSKPFSISDTSIELSVQPSADVIKTRVCCTKKL